VRIGKAEVEVEPGVKTKHVSLNELEEEKNRGLRKGQD